MTPAKRRQGTPGSQGPTRTAPDVPIVADPPPVSPPPTAPPDAAVSDVSTAPPDVPVPEELVTTVVLPAETKDSTEVLGPDGEPIAQEAPTDAGGDSAPPTETGQVDPEDRATTQSPGRPLALYPLPVWPD